jgi:tRNA(fMet)-specific endonuclease VapC
MNSALLLDTNICIALLNDKALTLQKRLLALAKGTAFVCSVVRSELIFGAEHRAHAWPNLIRVNTFLSVFESLPFDDAAADWCGRIRALLRARGTPIGPNDLMIASIALSNGLSLVSRNTTEFVRVPGL